MTGCRHHIDTHLLCADCAVESGEYRWTAAGELERVEIKTVQDLCDNPRHPRARAVFNAHQSRGFCGCDSCDAYRAART